MLVGLSVGRSPCAFSVFLAFLGAPAQMLELAFIITAPAHPHATSVAVYPDLFFFDLAFVLVSIDMTKDAG